MQGSKMKTKILATTAVATCMALALGACSSGTSDSSGGGGSDTVTVMYQRTEGITALDNVLQKAKVQFEDEHPGVTVDLQPVQATEDDYATQLALSLQHPSTAPDIFYQDTFRVRSDVAAGYLKNLDPYLAEWEDWENFNDAAKEAGRDDDGSIYAIPLGVDTRGIWYSQPVLEAAGIELPWTPATWDEILQMAAQVKASDPDVVPFHMYAGKPAGEGTVMQSFLPLLYGTGDRLYDDADQKWLVGCPGFVDSLTFLQTLYDEGYAVPVAEALDGNLWQTFFDWRFPDGKLGGVLEGSYAGSFWQEGGPYEWPEYVDYIDVAPFPTQQGDHGGSVSMSGGWTLAMFDQAKNPDLAFEFMELVFSEEFVKEYVIDASKITVRTDVAQDPEYLAADPHNEFFTEMLTYSYFRPATADYPRISTEIQEATEQVVVGNMTPEQAAASYDQAVVRIVGADNTKACE